MGGEWTLQQNQGSVAEKYMATGAGLITSGVKHNALLAFRAWGLRSRERWRLAREQPADAGARVCDQNPVICIFAGTNLLLFGRSVVSDSLRPRGPQHARPPCPSPILWACSNPCTLSWWCHPTVSSSVIPSTSCLSWVFLSFSTKRSLHKGMNCGGSLFSSSSWPSRGLAQSLTKQMFDECMREWTENAMKILVIFRSLRNPRAASQTRRAHKLPANLVQVSQSCPTSMQSTSWEMLGRRKHKLESRLPGEISTTSDMQMTLPLWQKAKKN